MKRPIVPPRRTEEKQSVPVPIDEAAKVTDHRDKMSQSGSRNILNDPRRTRGVENKKTRPE